MSTGTSLLTILFAQPILELRGEILFYKEINVKEEGELYIQKLKDSYEVFRDDVVRSPLSYDYFDLLNKLNDAIIQLTIFKYEELESQKSRAEGDPIAEHYEKRLNVKFENVHPIVIDFIIHTELSLADEIKTLFLRMFHERNQDISLLSKGIPSEISSKVLFKGEQGTLIGFFELLRQSQRFVFNSDNKYATPQKHMESFIKNNFLYQDGQDVLEISQPDIILSKIRSFQIEKGEKTKADRTKQKVDEILNTASGILELIEIVKESDIRGKMKK